ncbi:hypothetical protein ACE1ET_20305, partial [Saccharicrinis sp. FJH62]|uniref:hypothetical protein n=1 Tax=Saccharicrinis sp. FJH62 TaxID=3344657 RepID=UPI0035D4E34E
MKNKILATTPGIVHGSIFKPNNSTFAACSFRPDSSYPIGQKLPRHHTAGTLCATILEGELHNMNKYILIVFFFI